MIIQPALLMPLRFVDIQNINKSFDGNFASRQIMSWQFNPGCYLQKFQRSDKLTLQILSDEDLDPLEVYDNLGNLIDTLNWTQSEVTLLGYPDYKIFEIDQPFLFFNEGIYAFKQGRYESEAIDLRNVHEDTILLEYSNANNDKDVVFDTGLVYNFRTEAWIGNFTPKNNRDVYFDQKYDPSQLNSTAYRQFSLYVGFKTSVPDWVVDKVNHITQCDNVLYDKVKYQPVQDVEFETVRYDEYPYIGATLDIVPTNIFTKYITGTNPQEQTFTPVQKVDPYLNRSLSFSVAGKFRFNSQLECISTYAYTSGFTVRIGTTDGGNEIGEFDITEIGSKVYLVNNLFTEAETVYITGIDGQDISFWLVWKQLDEPPMPFSPPAQDALPKGAKILWSETTGVIFSDVWDASTGLGKPNSGWQKWTIAGKNGTKSMDDAYPVGINTLATGQDYFTLDGDIGANGKKILKPVLPAVGVSMFTGDAGIDSENMGSSTKLAFSRSIGNQPANFVMVKGNQNNNISIGTTSNLGDGEDFNVQPKSVISLWIIKIED